MPSFHDRFHAGLDQLEVDILRAKAALRRDLARVQAAPPPAAPAPAPAAPADVIDIASSQEEAPAAAAAIESYDDLFDY